MFTNLRKFAVQVASFGIALALSACSGVVGYPNLRAELTGTKNDALSYVGANIYRIQITLVNTSTSPVHLVGMKYLEDSSGNTFLAAGNDNVNKALVGSNCEGVDEGFQGDLNPQAGAFVPACFELQSGTHITKYIGKDDFGKVVFEVALDQVVAASSSSTGSQSSSANSSGSNGGWSPNPATPGSTTGEQGNTNSDTLVAPGGNSNEETVKPKLWKPFAASITKCVRDWSDPSCPGMPGVKVSSSNTFNLDARDLIKKLVDAGVCAEWTNNLSYFSQSSASCLDENDGVVSIVTGNKKISENLNVNSYSQWVAGDGWLLSTDYSGIAEKVAETLGGKVI